MTANNIYHGPNRINLVQIHSSKSEFRQASPQQAINIKGIITNLLNIYSIQFLRVVATLYRKHELYQSLPSYMLVAMGQRLRSCSVLHFIFIISIINNVMVYFETGYACKLCEYRSFICLCYDFDFRVLGVELV